ncbi:MAG: hypothetical protein EOO46_04320 [Flavobacterium sp.]|nr:MAG: hypothetical protein EOO46_04320 [Flavobacterium sp.]
METNKPKNTAAYIENFPEEIQKKLKEMRSIIQENASEADETISYAIPTFKLNGKVLVHFAGFKNHIGFYALPTGHEAFKKEFSIYKTGKGSVQFPLDKELPAELIAKVVKFRIQELAENQKNKTMK